MHPHRDEEVHECLFLFEGIKREYIQIVLLADYYELSMNEIAELLNMNYNTVVSHHKRGLREILKKRELYEKLKKAERFKAKRNSGNETSQNRENIRPSGRQS